MNVLPIPTELLCDEILLLVPSENDYLRTEISSVRVEYLSKVSEYSSMIVRDNSQLTVYYDCVNSAPSDVQLSAGMLLEYNGVRYEIIAVQQVKADVIHHYKITAKKV